jgi:hypothetical protein
LSKSELVAQVKQGKRGQSQAEKGRLGFWAFPKQNSHQSAYAEVISGSFLDPYRQNALEIHGVFCNLAQILKSKITSFGDLSSASVLSIR